MQYKYIEIADDVKSYKKRANETEIVEKLLE